MKRARKSEFSIRKLSVGVCSVVIGMSFLATNNVLAEEVVTNPENAAEALAQPVATTDSNTEAAVTELRSESDGGEGETPLTNPEEAAQEQSEETKELPSYDYSQLPADLTGLAFVENEIKKVENVVLDQSNGAKISFDETVKEHFKTSTSGTIYVEYIAPSNAGFHSIFNATSSSDENKYTSVYVNAGTLGVEIRTNQGTRHLKNGSERVKNGEWNSIALTYDKNPTTQETTLKLYANGVLSLKDTSSRDLFTAIPNFEHVQVGAAQRANTSKWGLNGMFVRNATIYNRVLTEEEVMQRSALFKREPYTPPVREGEEVSNKLAVFEGGSGNQKNANGVFSYRIPALFKTDKGTLIAAIDERNTTSGDWGDIATVVKRSSDNGVTWGDTIKIVDLRNSTSGPRQVDPFTIDPALVQDPTTKRIFALYDMMPDHVVDGLGGAFGVSPTPVEAYSTIEGKKYLNIFKGNEVYTVREDGRVYDPNGQATEYRVNVNDKSTHFANLGDLYRGDQLVGNIYFQHDTGESAFKVAKTMFIWMSYSDDDGVTWSRPRDLTSNFIQSHMKFLGLGPGAGIVLRTGEKAGRLVVPGYVANYTSGFSGSQSAFVFYSDDHGETWHMGKTFNDGRRLADGTVLDSRTMNNNTEQGTEATLVQLNNGDLKMFMRGLKGKVRVATSKNGGTSWENDVEIMEDVPDVYVQLSAVHLEREGKEYVVLANAGGPGRTNGHVRLAEVQENGTLKWINHRQIEDGKFAYNSLQYLGNDEFGLLYENSSGNQNDYTIYYKKFNWKFLNLPEPKLPENPLLSVEVDNNNFAILTFEKPILPTAMPRLLLSNGRTIEFITQPSDKHLIYRITEEDKGAAILDVATGDLSNINGFKTVLGHFISKTDTRKINKLDAQALKITAADVWQGGKGPDKLLDGDKESVTELLWDVSANYVDGKLPEHIRLPQTLTFTQRTDDPFNLHTMTISKRTPGNGTMTKYRVKAYLKEEMVHDSGELSVPFEQAEIIYSFGDGIRIDRLELIPLEARRNPDTVANQMLTLREVALYTVNTLEERRRNEVVETIAFRTEKIEDPTLPKGQEIVSVEGKNGSVTKLYDVVLINGVVSGNVFVGEKEGSRVEPITQVIRVGTKVEAPVNPPIEPNQPDTPSQPDTPNQNQKPISGAFVKPLVEVDTELHFKNGKGVFEKDVYASVEQVKAEDTKPEVMPMHKEGSKTAPANTKEAVAETANINNAASLPNTGSQTDVLSFMGLLGIGLGLAVARRTKRSV